MTAPTRFRDDRNAPAHVRELLRGAHPSRGLPADVRSRSASRLDRLLVLPAASGLLLWLKGAAVAAGVGVLGVAAATQIVPAWRHAASTRVPSASPRPASIAVSRPATHVGLPRVPDSPPAVTATPTPTPISGATAASSEGAAPEGTSSIESPPSPPVGVDSLPAETALLEEARAVLDSDPAAALGQLDAHAAAFPHGVLRMERELLAVDALGRLGRLDEARARGNILLRDARGSIYEGRVRAILEGLAR